MLNFFVQTKPRIWLVFFLLLAATLDVRAASYAAGQFSLPRGGTVILGSNYLFMQPDGNLVLYQGGTNVVLWRTGTGGQNCGSNQCSLQFQPDGNLAVYNGTTALWWSNTSGNPNATLVFSSTFPQIQILAPNGAPLWANPYRYAAGNFSLAQGGTVILGSNYLFMQPDGNLVLYQGGTNVVLWSTGTGGQNCGSNQCSLQFQPDGNLVVYNGSTALWWSNTSGNPNATLVLSSTFPQIQILAPNGASFWANTYQYQAGTFSLTQGGTVTLGANYLFMQPDGNLVLYQGGTNVVLWSTGTGGQNCGSNQCSLQFQPDGNLVVYNGTTAPWSSNTSGNPTQCSTKRTALYFGPPFIQFPAKSRTGEPPSRVSRLLWVEQLQSPPARIPTAITRSPCPRAERIRSHRQYPEARSALVSMNLEI